MLTAKTQGEKLAVLKTIICSYCPLMDRCKSNLTEILDVITGYGDNAPFLVGLLLMQEKNIVEHSLLISNIEQLENLEEDLTIFDKWLDEQQLKGTVKAVV